MTKLALLDTDFIIKANIIRAGEESRLIDLITDIHSFSYICHAQIVDEVSRHEQNAKSWLNKQISQGRIRVNTRKWG